MASLKAPSQRVVVFDLTRIMLIFLVINIHVRLLSTNFTNILSPFEYFAVPIFLLLSFFLMSKYFLTSSLLFSTLSQRIKRLIAPLLVWSAFGFIPHLNLVTPVNILIQIFTGEVVNVPLYYLTLLIVFTLLFWLLSYIPLSFRFVILFLFLVVCFVLQYTLLNYSFFAPTAPFFKDSYGRFVELLPYAIMGFFLGVSQKQSAGFALVTTLSCIGIALMSLFISLPTIPGFHYQGLALFFQSIGLFSLILLFAHASFPQGISTVISLLGKYSFGIYVFHFTLLEIILLFFAQLRIFMSSHSLIFLLLFIIFCYALCIGIGKITKHKFAYLFE